LGYLTTLQPSNAKIRCIIDDLILGVVCFNTKVLVHGRTKKKDKNLLRIACLHTKA
jgi:hypothetical protein